MRSRSSGERRLAIGGRKTSKARLQWESLEGRALLSGIIAQGAGAGSPPVVRMLDADSGAEVFHFSAYGPGTRGGVRVAVGDVDGDGSQDIVTVPGPGANPVAKVFRATDGQLLGQFPLPANWAKGGTWLAVGDVTADGRADIVMAPGLGAPSIRVYQGVNGDLAESFRADAGQTPGIWKSGAKVAVGDVTQDGFADIVAIPAYGASVVGVFDGKTGDALARYRSFAGASGGRTSVALADVDGNRRLDVVVGGPSGSTAVLRVFSGLLGTPLGQVTVADAANASGVRIAAINLGGRGADELAVAPANGRGTGVSVLSKLSQGLSGTSPVVAYRLPQGLGGSFLAGDSSVAVATPAAAVGSIEPPLSQALPVLERLAYYDPNHKQFLPVQADDPRLVGKDITVVTHGWAPGYQDWVDHEATQNQEVLKWWETFQGQPGYDKAWTDAHPTLPDAAFLLNPISADGTPISATGIAQTILARTDPNTGGPKDPNAVILAYSWIDDSATPTWDFLSEQIPEESYRSEALTTLNGERLAAALQQALGTSFTGKIELAGHSHGSKVVSVAAAALQREGLPVNAVATLDSPEDNVTVVGDAANYNWFFLRQLQGMDRSKGTGPFLQNVISEFGLPYSGLTLSNGGGANLNQVVDVKLFPDVYSSVDLGDRHQYAAAWYAGSGDTSVTYGQTVGQYWSPLLPANAGASNPVPGLPSYSEQNWGFFSQPVAQQYVLNPDSASTETIKFAPLGTADVNLTQAGTSVTSSPVSVRAPYYGQSGVSFDYQFPVSQPGDRLVILAGGKPAFVMDAALVGSGVRHATLSLWSLPFESHSLTFVLTSTASNTTSRVIVSNFQTFEQPVFWSSLPLCLPEAMPVRGSAWRGCTPNESVN